VPLKIVYSLTDGEDGWSEVFYTNQTDPAQYVILNPNGSFNNAAPALVHILYRAACLAPAFQLTHVRASLVGSPQVTLSAGITAGIGGGTYFEPGKPGNPPTPGADPVLKLLVRMQCGNTRRRTLWLGGLPNTIISPTKTYAPTATWNRALGSFMSAVVLAAGTPYGIVSRPLATTPPAAAPILTFTTTTDGLAGILTPLTQPAGNPNAWYVIIRGVKYPHGWNGVHKASVYTPNAAEMQVGPGRRAYVTAPAWTASAGGTVQIWAPAFTAFSNFTPERITSRKIGRPFGAPRGRLANW
jgi:hypothetical protein